MIEAGIFGKGLFTPCIRMPHLVAIKMSNKYKAKANLGASNYTARSLPQNTVEPVNPDSGKSRHLHNITLFKMMLRGVYNMQLIAVLHKY